MKKKLISMFLVFAMLCISLMGCAKSNDSETPTNDAASEGTATDTTTADADNYTGPSGNTPVVNGQVDTSEFVTVKMLVLGDPPAGGADKRMLEELNKILKERVNAELEMQWIEWNNYATKYQMELVSGSDIDLIFTTSTWLNLWENAEKGAFMDLTEMLPHYAKQLYADTTKEEWDGCTYKGKIVALPEHRKWQLSTPLFAYRADWAKEFGIEKIDSTDALEQYCKAILANKPEAIPYNVGGSASSNELYAMWFRQDTDYVLGAGSIGMAAPVANKSIEEPWTSVSPVFDDKFIDFAVKMKEWGDAGFWPQDVMSATVDTEAAFLSGTSGIYSMNVANYYPLFKKLEDENADAELGAFFFDEKRGFAISDVMTQDACSVTANAKNPERALMIYDLFQYDPEIYHLTQYGIEGEQYIVNEAGFRERPTDYVEEEDAYLWDMWSTRNDALEIPEFNEFQAQIDEVNAKIKPWTVLNPWGSFIVDSANWNAQVTAINEAGTTWLPAIQFGKAGDPVEAVNQYRDALKNAGIDEYMAEVERQMKEYTGN
ncbi:MAG: family 1 extracellular solute-binding protein [Herbinix sp.]|jgi:putative aldouronate transport system substrate-binding protein|nr:family 1 extracellular solute-binding protein [Herbinix sp.]